MSKARFCQSIQRANRFFRGTAVFVIPLPLLRDQRIGQSKYPEAHRFSLLGRNYSWWKILQLKVTSSKFEPTRRQFSDSLFRFRAREYLKSWDVHFANGKERGFRYLFDDGSNWSDSGDNRIHIFSFLKLCVFLLFFYAPFGVFKACALPFPARSSRAITVIIGRLLCPSEVF